MCFCCLGVLFGVYVQTVTRRVMGSGHHVESCDTSTRLCEGILFSSSAFLKSDLQVPIALSAKLFA